jgi:peptide/nickel transport system permease protein
MRVPLLTLGFVMTLVLFAPILTTANPMATDAEALMQPPSNQHWLGTDQLGRDVWSRSLYGGRRTLVIATAATVMAAGLGLGIGLFADWAKHITMIAINTWLAFPNLLLGLVILTLLGQGVFPLMIAIGITQIAPFALVVRAAVTGVRKLEFVEAAHAAGATRLHVMLRHILPNIQPTVLSYTGVIFGYSIINSAAFSFLGLGGEPGVADWGVMLAEGRAALRAAPWIGLVPGLAITLTVLSINTLADKLISRVL